MKSYTRNNRKVRNGSARRGVLTIELIVAMILLGTVAAVLPVTLNAVYKQRQQERFERYSQLELAILITRLQINETEPLLSDWFQERYPDAIVDISTGQTTDDLKLIPTTVSIRRKRSDSQLLQQQTLTTWIERQEGDE